MRMERDLKGRYHELLRAHPAAILQHGGWQDSARHLCHLVAHAELKLLDKRVGLVIRAPHLPDTELLQTKGRHSRHSVPSATLVPTSLLISSCLSGAERAVALIMVDVWLSVSFLMQRWPATTLHT